MSAQFAERTILTEEPSIYRHPRTQNFVTSLRVKRRTYSDGGVAFVCGDCGYEREKFFSVFGHLGSHAPGRNQAIREGQLRRNGLASMDKIKADVLTVLDRLVPTGDDPRVARLEHERDEFKARALAAEKTIKTLRNSIKALGLAE